MAEALCQEILRRRDEALERRIEKYPRNNPIASDLGPCTREMVLSMSNWQDRPLIDPWLKARFERGNLIEDAVIRELGDLGIRVRVERKPFEVRDNKDRLILRGKIDGFVSMNNRDNEYPMEVKTLDPNVFRRVETAEDFTKISWMAKYPRQLQSYLYANNLEAGFFLLDDCLGHWKLIPVPLDYESMEKILQQCEQAVTHREAGTLPDYHQDASVCRRCWAYGRACNPPMEFHGLQLIADPEFEELLNRRGELEKPHKEYESVDKQVKSRVKEQTGLVVGDWLIQGNWVQKKAYSVEAGKYWKTDITKAGS